ncbi:WD40 repeat domain-containing protein [Paludisphaera mucosa]|uniref:WD40 repeat domain-containing protein n=1 Tax=Paludisphaera mucosa TaxID=3030827 RepID=A0ABT6FGI2_9BACT|nr:hypothetical protein [Paludisphaera mucosa]MDG3006698.1 hypothetical protein [Paludisphaera mucosa]
MNDEQSLGRIEDERAEGGRRTRGGRVRLSWVSWEAAVFLLVSAIVAVILSTRLDIEDEGRGRSHGSTTGGHDDLLEALALDTNRDVLISSGSDDTVRFWDLDLGKPTWGEEVLTLPHDSHPYALAPSADGRYLAVGGAKHLAVWENGAEGWKPLVAKEGSDYRYLAFAPDSRSLAIGGETGEIRILAIPSMEERVVLKGLTDMVHSVAFSVDGDRVAASTFGGELRIWDWKTGREQPIARKLGRVHCFAFSPDGRTIATAAWRAGEGGGAILWDLASGEVKARMGGDEGFNALAFSPGGGLIAAAGVNQTIQLWDARTGEVRGTLDKGVGWVKTILFTQGGSRLAYGGRDGAIRFWDVPAAPADKRLGTRHDGPKSRAG